MTNINNITHMNVQKHWKDLIIQSGRSPAELSVAIGNHRSYLSKLLSSHSFEPGAFTAQKLAIEIGVSLEHLLGGNDTISVSNDPNYIHEVHKQASNIMTDVMRVAHQRLAASGSAYKDQDILRMLLHWWHQQGGILSGHEVFENKFDLINVPDNDDVDVVPQVVGAESLAAQQLRTNDPQALIKLIETFDETSRRSMTQSYIEVATTGRPNLSPAMSVSIPSSDGFKPSFEYFRLQLPVATRDGSRFVLSYCFSA
jgi:hypothetical protein